MPFSLSGEALDVCFSVLFCSWLCSDHRGGSCKDRSLEGDKLLQSLEPWLSLYCSDVVLADSLPPVWLSVPMLLGCPSHRARRRAGVTGPHSVPWALLGPHCPSPSLALLCQGLLGSSWLPCGAPSSLPLGSLFHMLSSF